MPRSSARNQSTDLTVCIVGNGIVSRNSAFGQIGAIAASSVFGFRLTATNDRSGVKPRRGIADWKPFHQVERTEMKCVPLPPSEAPPHYFTV